MIKRIIENLSFLGLNRFVYKRLMTLNGISNVLIILRQDMPSVKNIRNQHTHKLFSNSEFLDHYTCPARLVRLVQRSFFGKKGSLLCIIKRKKIIAYAWIFTNQDPNGDIKNFIDHEYNFIGNVFVSKNYRGKGLASELLIFASEYIAQVNNYPIYATISFDNLASIKTFKKNGYILHSIIIKTRSGLIAI